RARSGRPHGHRDRVLRRQVCLRVLRSVPAGRRLHAPTGRSPRLPDGRRERSRGRARGRLRRGRGRRRADRQAGHAVPRRVARGGVHWPVRAFGSVGSPPLAITDAWGARVRDADGLDYVDWIGAWGPALFGHNPAFVREAIERQLGRGVLFGLMSPPEVELAERVTARVPGMDMVRFVATGTEAA